VNGVSSLESLNLGLIGAGPWGRNYISTIAGLDGVRLSRLANRNPESPALAGTDCRISEDWRDMLAAGDLDGVIVATPAALHTDMTLAALDHSLPVLVEKPMTLSVTEAEAVLSQARAKDAIVRVNHIHLYSAAWEALKREAQALGPLNAISTVAGKWRPSDRQAPVLWEWGSHDVAMCLDLVGRPPVEIAARVIERRKIEEGPDRGEGMALALELNFGDITAKIAVSDLYEDANRLFTASFEGGELVYDDTAPEKLRLKTTPRDSGDSFKLGPGTPLERAVLDFCAAIRKGHPDYDDAALGRDVVKVLEQLQATLD
jgi:predicted dehydrogenase